MKKKDHVTNVMTKESGTMLMYGFYNTIGLSALTVRSSYDNSKDEAILKQVSFINESDAKRLFQMLMLHKIHVEFHKTALFVDKLCIQTLFLNLIADVIQKQYKYFISCLYLLGERDLHTKIYVTMGITITYATVIL